jgi:CheY-like chemotaxis protein
MTSARDKTILVVDDEPNVRNYLRAVLEDADFNVLTAADGEEALRIIREKRPDFISLDLVMPRRSGQKVLYELKKDKELSRIPVLIVTAHAKTEMGKGQVEDLIKDAALSGPGLYLEKPVSPSAYVRCVQRALGLEESEESVDKINLKVELEDRLKGASPEALRRALEALDKN